MSSTNSNLPQDKTDIALTHPKHRTDLDGLRGIAVLLVICFHLFPDTVRGGFIGVDIFFVLSGYLISIIIFSNLSSNTFSFKIFYSRRIRRIFPALLVILIACYVLGWFILFANEYKQLCEHIAGGAGFISNFLLWKESGYFDKAADTKPLLHLWSLGIEEQFYILFPFLIWIAHKMRFNLLILLVGIASISFFLNILTIHQHLIATFYSPVTRSWELIAGSLLAYFDLNKKQVFPRVIGSSIWPEILSILGFIFIALALRALTPKSYLGGLAVPKYPGWLALLPTLGAVLVISTGPKALLNRAILSNGLLVWFGLISYPLYLWNYLLFSFTRIIESDNMSGSTRMMLVMISITLAWITYKFIEKPIRFGNFNKIKVIALCLLMIVVGLIGFIGYKADGFPFRESPLQSINQNQLTWPKHNEAETTECFSLVGLDYSKIRSKHHPPDCLLSGERDNIKLAILGDSTAGVLMSGFEKDLNKNEGIIYVGAGGCIPYRGLIAKDEDYIICSEVNRKAYDFVLKNPSIKTIILGFGGWDFPSNGASWENIFSLLSLFVQKDISALKKAGKKIVVTFDQPVLGKVVTPEDCLPRLFKTNISNCKQLEPELIDRHPFLEYWKNIFKNNNDVCIFYQSKALMSGDFFTMVDSNGILLFRDQYHLSDNGSDKVVHAFMNSKCSKYLE